jgi:phosphoenolpyruvate phosphomutase
MIAMILNSGIGSRMGRSTENAPKCLTEVSPEETILGRQLRQIAAAGIRRIVITTGAFAAAIESFCASVDYPLAYEFVHNPAYAETNYIYSMYLARESLHDDVVLMHGDLVMEDGIIELAVGSIHSCMVVSSEMPLPEKDFKAVVVDGQIAKVGIEFFDHAVAAQPLYKLLKEDFQVWLERIARFCEVGNTGCYAENALNEITDRISLYPLDIKGRLCAEIDTPQDLVFVSSALSQLSHR